MMYNKARKKTNEREREDKSRSKKKLIRNLKWSNVDRLTDMRNEKNKIKNRLCCNLDECIHIYLPVC